MSHTALQHRVICGEMRAALKTLAARLTTADDEHLIVDNARTLEAWIAQAGTCCGAAHRLLTLAQVYACLSRIGKLPMDRPEELIGKAAVLHHYRRAQG